MASRLTGRKVRGIRDPIPAGYVLGRLSAGEGDTQLIHLSDLGTALVSAGGGSAGGVAGGASVKTLQQQATGTQSQVSVINATLAAATASFFIQKDIGDETTGITAGTGKKTFRMPGYFTLGEVRASLTTAQATGSIFTVDLKQNGSTVFSTLLTIDNTEKTSVTAATPSVLSITALNDDDEMRIDVTQIGDGTAQGLKVTLLGTNTTSNFIPSLDFSDARNSQYLGAV